MNRLTIAASLASALIACTDGDADIGIEQQPVKCVVDQATGEVRGQFETQFSEGPFAFGAIETTLNRDFQTNEIYGFGLSDKSHALYFNLACRQGLQRGSYDVFPNTSDSEPEPQFPCPFALTSSLLANDNGNKAVSGKVIIDENETCIAGRFSVDYGAAGKATGWFSVPTHVE